MRIYMKHCKINHSGFKFEIPKPKSGWKELNVKPVGMSGDFFPMREWQERAFNLLSTEQYMILNAPPGSGKSWLACLLSAYKMKQDGALKCIISVPQTIIAKGFAEAKLLMPNGDELHWSPQHNLCKDTSEEGNVNYIINWLNGPYGSFNDRILLCTHAALVALFKKLKANNQLNLLDKLLLWVDEAHHLKNVTIAGFEDGIISNDIGKLIVHAMNKPSVQIGLITATFFRGDRLTVLTEQMENKYTRFHLPYDEYFKSMKYLRSFSFDFLLCGVDYTKAIGLLAKNRKKDIIHIPHPQSRYSIADKLEEVRKIVDELNFEGGDIVKSDTLTTINRRDGKFILIDLVDENSRKDKKKYLTEINENKNALDTIVALGMFKEGADWVWAERAIIVGARASLVDTIQMSGRVFRDAKDKEHVEVIQLLPFSLDQKDESEFRDNLNNYLKAILASLILENILHPVQIKMKGEKSTNSNDNQKSEDWLSDLLPNDAKQLSLIEEVSNKLLEICDVNKKAGDVTVLWDEYQKIIPSILKSYGVVNNAEEVSKQIWGMFARQSLRMQGIDVEAIPFDILQKTQPLDFLLRYTSGSCGIDTFSRLRTAIKGVEKFMPFDELKRIIHDMRSIGQCLATSKEYYVWRKNNCDYNAVLEYRKKHVAAK